MKLDLLGTHVLAFNTRKGRKQAFLVNVDGGFTKLYSFSFPPDTEYYCSCSLVFKDKMFIFGGEKEKRQISQVAGCGLYRDGTLDFDFRRGACTVFKSRVLLCFDFQNSKGRVCRVADSPTGSFSKIPDSHHHHYMINIASNEGKSVVCFNSKSIIIYNSESVIAVGNDGSLNYVEKAHSKAEMYSHSTSSWKMLTSYPYHNIIHTFQIIAHLDHFILFGGHTNKPGHASNSNLIAKFSPTMNQWKLMGTLKQARHGLGIVEVNTKFLVIGGSWDKLTEICEKKSQTIECTSREPKTYEFLNYPAMIIVPSDFADKC